MSWKIFSLISAFAFSLGVIEIDLSKEIWRIIGVAIDAIGIAGLLLYAFTEQPIKPAFWKIFSIIFAIWVVLSWGWGAYAIVSSSQSKGIYAVLGVIVAFIWQAANWVAVNRLGKRPSAAKANKTLGIPNE